MPPYKSVVYLVVTGEQNPRLFDEFIASYVSLRHFHPDIPVVVYQQNLTADELAFLGELTNVTVLPISVDRGGRFAKNNYRARYNWIFPELHVLAAKIDTLLLTPGDSLFLDTDTEVLASLDECLQSTVPWMHKSEGRFAERDVLDTLQRIDLSAYGWSGDLSRLQVYNSGSIWVPQDYKVCLYAAKELLWALSRFDGAERGDNRLDEQYAVSIALQEAYQFDLPELAPRVYHYWQEKHSQSGEWYRRVHCDEDSAAVLA